MLKDRSSQNSPDQQKSVDDNPIVLTPDEEREYRADLANLQKAEIENRRSRGITSSTEQDKKVW